MEKGYWLSRKTASLRSARHAASAEARLIHRDLAARYSVKADSAETRAIDLADSLRPAVRATAHEDSLKEASE
jgi:hypothetical protein